MTATHGVGTYGNGVGTVTPLDHKMAQLGLMLKIAANTIRAGVFWDGNATIVSGKANMSYDVRALAAVLSRGATSGAVLLTNDSVYNVVTTAAPGSNSRYDVVYQWQREFSLDGTDSNPVIGVVQGSAAASPTVPSLAAFPGAIALATILVPSGVTATNTGTTITQVAPFTTLADGTVVTRTTTEMNAYTPLKVGDKAFNLFDSVLYRWNGAAWKPWESDWISYTPTVTGITLGTGGTVVATYKWVEGDVWVDWVITLGTGGLLTAQPTITLPVTAKTPRHTAMTYTGGGSAFHSAGSNIAPLVVTSSGVSATIVQLWHSNAGAYAAVGAASPFTFAASDVLQGKFLMVAA